MIRLLVKVLVLSGFWIAVPAAPTDSTDSKSIVKRSNFDHILKSVRQIETVCSELNTKYIPERCRADADNLGKLLVDTSRKMTKVVVEGNTLIRCLKQEIDILHKDLTDYSNDQNSWIGMFRRMTIGPKITESDFNELISESILPSWEKKVIQTRSVDAKAQAVLDMITEAIDKSRKLADNVAAGNEEETNRLIESCNGKFVYQNHKENDGPQKSIQSEWEKAKKDNNLNRMANIIFDCLTYEAVFRIRKEHGLPPNGFWFPDRKNHCFQVEKGSTKYNLESKYTVQSTCLTDGGIVERLNELVDSMELSRDAFVKIDELYQFLADQMARLTKPESMKAKQAHIRMSISRIESLQEYMDKYFVASEDTIPQLEGLV